MTTKEKIVLQDIVNAIENLATSVDALESALIRRGQLTTGEIDSLSPTHATIVAAKLSGLRLAIASL
jgi:hypothetical protein